MNFLSLNVCGIRDANKRMSLMQWLSHRRVDIVCFQETHTISSTESSSWFSPFGFLAVSAAGTAHARGLAILFRPRLFLNRSWVELGGRFVMAEFMDGNFLFRVVCIYAPNRNPERDSFLLSCSDFIDPSIPTLLGGDFNAVFDRTKDRRGSAADSAYRDSSISLRSLFSEACVFDVWRRLHPDTIAFSWTRRDGLLASRIDLFGCPVSWAHGVHACDLIPCPYSDHVAIVLRVSPPPPSFIEAPGAGSSICLYCAIRPLYLLSNPSGPLGGRRKVTSGLFSCGGIGARNILGALLYPSAVGGSRSEIGSVPSLLT